MTSFCSFLSFHFSPISAKLRDFEEETTTIYLYADCSSFKMGRIINFPEQTANKLFHLIPRIAFCVHLREHPPPSVLPWVKCTRGKEASTNDQGPGTSEGEPEANTA